VTIILDFRFAIFDRGKNREDVAAKNAKNTKTNVFIFAPFVFFAVIHFGRSLSLRFAHDGVVRPVSTKSRPRNLLMVNAVKLSQTICGNGL
jgi:hypothetical protein